MPPFISLVLSVLLWDFIHFWVVFQTTRLHWFSLATTSIKRRPSDFVLSSHPWNRTPEYLCDTTVKPKSSFHSAWSLNRGFTILLGFLCFIWMAFELDNFISAPPWCLPLPNDHVTFTLEMELNRVTKNVKSISKFSSKTHSKKLKKRYFRTEFHCL